MDSSSSGKYCHCHWQLLPLLTTSCCWVFTSGSGHQQSSVLMPGSGPLTAGALCALLHSASSMPSSCTVRQCVLKHCSRQHTHTPDGPDLLVWSCFTLVCFALNGEPSSAWQFLPADIWQTFFCGSKTSRPDATGGGAPLVCLQEEHILLCCVPFLSCGCSEATLVLCHHPTGDTEHCPVLCPALNSPGAARGAAVRPLT